MKRLEENEKIIAKNVLITFAVRGAGLLLSLFSTPLFLRFFNEDKGVLGVWYTLLSVLSWFMTFDLGIGNGIRNKLVHAFTKNEKLEAKKIISSGIFSNVVVTAVLIVVGTVLIGILDLNKFLNISEQTISPEVLKRSAYVVFIAIMLRFLLTIVHAVFYAMQASAVNNLLSLCSSVLQFLFVLLFRCDTPGQALLSLAVAYLITANAPTILSGIIIFATKLKWCIPSVKCIEKQHVRGVMGIGAVFFACQIMFMLIMNTNEAVISNLFGPQYTTEYTFYFKITSLISTTLTLAMTPIWSIVTKSIAEKNYIWTKKLYGILKLVGLAAAALEFLLIPFLQFIMDVWLGKGTVTVDYGTAFAFACFGSVFVYIGILSTIVCGMTRMKLQTISYVIAMVMRFALIFVLAEFVESWNLVIWCTTIVLLPYCIIQHIDLDIYFNKKIKEGQST
ncbi:MAG: hypothetical protein E7593_05770 [Ruminococcaceae bacterium]|nr:hypothetical protein [Oscillospiraceae bacterium]MBE6671691.1 hypothetical protein [Oscillospiraceae bacterium]